MNATTRIEAFLKQRGCPGWVVEAGLPGLVQRWEETGATLAKGYPLGLDEYLNDMDVRQLIADTLPLATQTERKKLKVRVIKADTRIKKLLKPVKACLWGAGEAKRNGWTVRKSWWYFHLPRHPGPDLLAELADDSD
jgi:hypothetical protein